MKNRKRSKLQQNNRHYRIKQNSYVNWVFFIIEFEIFNHIELMVQGLICAENIWKKLGRNARYRRDSNR